MKTERLNGTVYEVHSFVVALPCGHIDTLEVRVREADPDKEDYLADCIAATEAGKNAALPVCRRCWPTHNAERTVNVAVTHGRSQLHQIVADLINLHRGMP